MARAQRADATSTNSDGGRGDVARGALARYLEHLSGQPLALDAEEQHALLRAAEAAVLCDRAIVVVLHTALRLSELVAVDVDDVRISARKGLVIVRSGKRDTHREILLNPTARGALEAWLAARPKLAAEGERGSLWAAGARSSVRGRRCAPRGSGRPAQAVRPLRSRNEHSAF